MKLILSCRIPPCKGAVVQIQAPGIEGTSLLEPRPLKMNLLEVEEALLDFSEEGIAQVVVANPSHLAHVVREGTVIGTVSSVAVTNPISLLVDGEGSANQEESATSSVMANAAGGSLDLCVPALETHSQLGRLTQCQPRLHPSRRSCTDD